MMMMMMGNKQTQRGVIYLGTWVNVLMLSVPLCYLLLLCKANCVPCDDDAGAVLDTKRFLLQ